MKHFSDKVIESISTKKSFVIVGIDLSIDRLPGYFLENMQNKYKSEDEFIENSLFEYAKDIIDATFENSIGIKIQSAYFEQYSYIGMKALKRISDYASSLGHVVILDAKKSDISSTAAAYANAYLGNVKVLNNNKSYYSFDAMTINPLLGFDSIKPFLDVIYENKKGIFILVKTSNPSSQDFQDLYANNKKIYEIIASKVFEWTNSSFKGYNNYNDVGVVVGATQPEAGKIIRSILPNYIFLLPGVGAQGGDLNNLKLFVDSNNSGIIVNSSRDIIYAYEKIDYKDFEKSAYLACKRLKDDINNSI